MARAAAAMTLGAASRFCLSRIGRFLVVADPLQPADGVVPLTSPTRRRVEDAARLFAEGYARWFVVPNTRVDLPGIRGDFSALVRTEARWHGVPEESFLVTPGLVRATHDELLAIRALALSRGLRSLIIVTDPFHTRRTRLIAGHVFRRSGITIRVRPVRDHWYRAESWWQRREGCEQTWWEYLKLLLYFVGYRPRPRAS